MKFFQLQLLIGLIGFSCIAKMLEPEITEVTPTTPVPTVPASKCQYCKCSEKKISCDVPFENAENYSLSEYLTSLQFTGNLTCLVVTNAKLQIGDLDLAPFSADNLQIQAGLTQVQFKSFVAVYHEK